MRSGHRAAPSHLARAAPVATLLLVLAGAAGCKEPPAPAVVPSSPAAQAPSSQPTGPSTPAGVFPAGSTSGVPLAAEPAGGPWRFSFDTDVAESPPTGFSFGTTGKARPGRWLVRSDTTAPSAPGVLVQTDSDDTDMRFPVAITGAPSLKDARVSVRCKPISGKVDQACGLVLRYQDENNYLVTRANALEGNVRLYTVKAGSRRQLASFSGAVKAGVWQSYRFEAQGDLLKVFWEGVLALEHRDSTLLGAGRAGVWTKADSVVAFDDLVVENLGKKENSR
jgi:hypothetical protein